MTSRTADPYTYSTLQPLYKAAHGRGFINGDPIQHNELIQLPVIRTYHGNR